MGNTSYRDALNIYDYYLKTGELPKGMDRKDFLRMIDRYRIEYEIKDSYELPD